MDVWNLIKKGIIFLFISIFVLMILSLIPSQFSNQNELASNQNLDNSVVTDAVKPYKAYQNAEVNVEVVELETGLNLLQTLIDEASVNVVSSSIFSTEVISTSPVAQFVIEVPRASMTDFLGKLSSSLQVSEIKTYTDNDTIMIEGIDSWIKNLSIQEQRYQELLSDAYEVGEILEIEKELSRVRTELDEWQVRKEQRDTVTVTISFYLIKNPAMSWQASISDELVTQVGNITFYSRILVVKMIGLLPYFVLLLVGLVLARLVFRRGKRRR